ncbi:hypothetical protein [Xenorhabdus innexi]|uniref:Uncharacterized protein n=1 Tax=Xenorhabdus innexi TaxID=290109 RepID=A0A1N6MWG5_9GAMM|nr:hypothetical protein [Xenorhabdus innexi]PHM35944.1 hypothetical protein Xinn_02014 [Xenorhabdus innexi]SIP73243.1 hypothetical protein XIS1_1790049 [Xenorhabdus innexi]
MNGCENDRTLGNRPMRRGKPGESAYEFWKEHQPSGSDTSECAFEKYMEGKTGESAYEFWKEQQSRGSDTSKKAFEKYMEGKTGESAYEFWKSKQPVGADTSEKAFEKYMEGKTGESAYEFWKSKQPVGADTSEKAFEDSMKGKVGPTIEDKISAKDASIITTQTTVDETHKTTTIGVQLSNQKGNALTLEKDGLFSAGGTGKGASVSAKEDNVLFSEDDGLYVPKQSFLYTQFQVKTDSQKPDDPTKVSLFIANDVSNGLTYSEKGLYVVGITKEVARYLSVAADSEVGDLSANTTAPHGGIALGVNATGTGAQAIALGISAQAIYDQTIAIGLSAQSTEKGAIAIGKKSSAFENAIAVGNEAQVTAKGSVAIGYQSSVTTPDTVSIGNVGANLQRTLTNVAAGTLPYDAVNVEQLQKVVNVKELPSTKENPVDFNTLSGPMTYIIWEGDYDATTNPTPNTIKNGPTSDPSAKIRVIVSGNGSYQIALIPNGVVVRDFMSASIDFTQWADLLNSNMAQIYIQDIAGSYWLASNNIFSKDQEDKVFTEGKPDVIFSGFKKVNPQDKMGEYRGGVIGFAHDGRVKLYLDTTILGDTLPPQDLYSLATISDAYKNNKDNIVSLLPADASLGDVIKTLNQVIQLLSNANMLTLTSNK